MNKILTLTLFLWSVFCQAQTLHTIIIADTEDPKPPTQSIGNSCKKDEGHIDSLLHAVAQSIGFEYKVIKVLGKEFGRKKAMEAVAQLVVQPNDVIFCFYAGHGYSPSIRTSIFPLLYFRDDNTVGLDDLHQQLISSKQAKFIITLGDCCSQILQSVLPPITQAVNRGIDVTKDVNILRKLFAESTGNLLICSTKTGELARADSYHGGFYTHSWQEALIQATSNNNDITWETLLEDSKQRLENLYNATDPMAVLSGKAQTPHWIFNYQPDRPQPIVPEPKPAPKPIINFADINEFLNKLANEQIPFSERSTLRNTKKDQYFDTTSQVKIYKDDPERPLETQDINKFLSLSS